MTRGIEEKPGKRSCQEKHTEGKFFRKGMVKSNVWLLSLSVTSARVVLVKCGDGKWRENWTELDFDALKSDAIKSANSIWL